MNVSGLLRIADRWRARAAEYRRVELHSLAALVEKLADELVREVRRWQNEPHALKDAARMSGYSAKHLADLVREGVIPDLRPPGSKGPIMIRRRDLPLRPGRSKVDDHPSTSEVPEYDDPVDDLAAAILDSRRSPIGASS